MWEACEALRDALLVLGPGIDGGKDSLSMAAKVVELVTLYGVVWCGVVWYDVLCCVVLC